MTITGKAKRAAVVGWPIDHSISPQLHAYWLDKHNIDGVMIPMPVRPEDFVSTIRTLQRSEFRGVNVTIPHKEAAYKIADTHDDAANFSHTANLLLFHEDGSIEGRNTDSYGLSASVEEELGKKHLNGRNVVVLGAGGAAKAVVLALHVPLGAARIHVLNRHRQRAEQIISDMSRFMHADKPHEVESRLIAGSLDDWPHAAIEASLVVNATSAGMIGNPRLNIDLAPLPKHAIVCDVVYNPLETELLRKAKAAGHQTIDGLGMLMYQAAPSFQAFFDEVPEITDDLRRVLIKALHER